MRNSLIVLAALVLWMGSADAGGRKRIVVLDFEGPKAEKFHEDLVKLLKKSHTVLSVDKWNEKADELDAGKVTEKNVKKIAKKLKVDGVVTGKIEKRRDEYIIRIKLRAGTSGEIVGNSVQTKAEGPRLDAQAQRDIKDELVSAIEELESNRAGGGDEEDEEEADTPKKKHNDEEEEDSGSKKGGFVKKSKMNADEEESEEEAPPKLTKKQKAEEEKKKKEEEKKQKAEEEKAKKEEERLAKEEEAKKKKEDEQRRKEEADKAEKAFASRNKGKKDEEEEESGDEEDSSKTKKRAKTAEEEEDEDGGGKKRKAAREEDEEGVEESAEADSGEGRDLSIAGRALDAVVGMSFTARSLKFAYAADLAKPPPGYKQPVPVAGALVDITAYPLAFGKGGGKGIIKGLGLTLLYDRVLVINSQKRYSDAQGAQQIANLSTAESRWAVGPVLRYPMGKVVLGGSLTYGKQQFAITQKLPNNDPTDIPSVNYTMITPAAFVKYPVTPKIAVNADLAFHAITNTGQIQASGMTGYGAATVTGFELEAGGDYMVTKNIFARVSLRYEAISFKFKGDPTSQTNIRDTDPEQDVSGAKDTYMGGTATVGYVY